MEMTAAFSLHPLHADIGGRRVPEDLAVKRADGKPMLGPVTYRGLGLLEQPASPARFAAEAASCAGRLLPAKALRKAAGAQEPGRERVSLDLETRCLRIELSEDPGNMLQVPLLRAEVAHAKAAVGGHFIAVVPDCGAEGLDKEGADLGVWLLMLDGDDAALFSALEALSILGAIRTGLQKAFILSCKELGTGGCATVYLGHSKGSEGAAKTPVAIKLAREPGSKSDKALLNEMPLLAAAQGHNNVIQFLGLFRADNVVGHLGTQWALALELHGDGDLQDWIFRRGPQCEGFATKIHSGVLAAIAHIHARGIVHRDVKSENILLAEGGNKGILTDFGLAALECDTEAMSVSCGSAGYVAPEVLRHNVPYDSKVDVFGLGVTLYYTLSNTLPFTGGSMGQVLRRNVRCSICLESNEQLKRLSPAAKEFLTMLLQPSPERRASAAAALAHLWLAPRQRRPSFVKLDARPAWSVSDASPRSSLEKSGLEGLALMRPRLAVRAERRGHSEVATPRPPTAPRALGQAGPAPRRRPTAPASEASTSPSSPSSSSSGGDSEGTPAIFSRRILVPGAAPAECGRRPFRLLTGYSGGPNAIMAGTPTTTSSATGGEDRIFGRVSGGCGADTPSTQFGSSFHGNSFSTDNDGPRDGSFLVFPPCAPPEAEHKEDRVFVAMVSAGPRLPRMGSPSIDTVA